MTDIDFCPECGAPVVGGGTSVNSIPIDMFMLVDMRSESPEELKKVDEAFQRVVREFPGTHAAELALWFAQLLKGDLGHSIISDVPVAALISDRLGPSLALGAATIFFSIPFCPSSVPSSKVCFCCV